MAKTIFEEMGGTYTQVGDYYLPDLKLPEEEKRANIGVWGMRHKRFLRENHRVLYANLITSGKLVTYLDDIEQQATAMFLRLVKELAEKENVNEELKATDQRWCNLGILQSRKYRYSRSVGCTVFLFRQ
jgi:hypothetical protein